MAMGPLQVGLLAACPALTGSLLRIPFGVAVDRMGGKRPTLVLLSLTSAGIAGVAATVTLFPQPSPAQWPLFLAFGSLCGCGIAIFSVGIPTISYWYPQHKQGSILALYGGLGNLAPGIFAIALPVMVLSVGLTYAYFLWLAFLLAILVLLRRFMEDAPYFQYRHLGLPTDRKTLLSDCGEELVPTGTGTDSIRKAVHDRRAWALTFFYFVSFGGFVALTVWFPTYWTGHFHTSLVAAGSLTALYSLSTSLLRVLGGLCSDRFGGERTAVTAYVVVAAGSILLAGAGDSMGLALAGMMTLALGMGFANAGVFKLVPKYVPDAVGGAAGLVGGLGALGGFVIPLLLGFFVRANGRAGYPAGFALFLGLSVACLVLFGALRKWSREQRNPTPGFIHPSDAAAGPIGGAESAS
jgi:NNP family nitrate/nitrite transporter-like MFS transporter